MNGKDDFEETLSTLLNGGNPTPPSNNGNGEGHSSAERGNSNNGIEKAWGHSVINEGANRDRK